MRYLQTLLQDLHFGARQLRLNPGFTAVAALSLALGIGANTAIFQLVDAVRLRTIPVANPQELAYVDFGKGSMRSGNFSTRSSRFTFAQWEEVRAHQEAFNGAIAWSAIRFNLVTGGEPHYAEGLFVSANFFRVLGVQPVLGRTFSDGEDQPGCGSPGAVVSYAFWQRELAGDAGVLSRSVSLEGRTFPIIGITPAEFYGVEVGNRYDVAVPLCADPLFFENGKGRADDRTKWWISVMGRLKPGWTVERANALFQTLSPGIMQASLPPSYRPDEAKRYLANKLTVTDGATGVSQLRRAYENPLWLLLATTGLVLLIACANLANLLLARASVREREIAVRQAIGASRGRLVAQLLAESLLLAALGTGLGALLATFLSHGLVAFLSKPNDAMFLGLALDLRVLGFTAAIGVSACLLFGLLPALRATRIAPASAMRAAGRGLTAGRERFSLRRGLVISQVALSLVLLFGALLFARSLQKLLTVDPGFRAEGVVVVDLDLRRAHFSKERLPLISREMLAHFRSMPGVTSAAIVNMTPISGSGWNEMVYAEGSTAAHQESNFNRASPGYFQTMGTALVAGREFDQRDNLTSPHVAIVNEAFVKRFYNGAIPLGKVFRVDGPAGKVDEAYQIVGVMRNAKHYAIREDFEPMAFFPIAQDPFPDVQPTFVLRTSLPPAGLFRNIKSAVAGIHSAIGLRLRVLSEQLQESLLRDRLMATLAGAFGLLAALLATLGLYGVIAYMVARRRNEIGVRMALGADRARVIRLVLREALVLLAGGLAVGTGLALWAGQAAGAMLFGLKPRDPLTLAAAIALLAAVALLASYAPARRASRLEPMNALREE